ncbi:MAG: ATP-dependent helicase [Kofleriaceae bacterium]
MTAPTWQRLQREARAERRQHDGGVRGDPAGAPMVPAPTATVAAIPAARVDPGVIAARLAAVAAKSPRLHARLAALDPDQRAAVLSDEPAALVRAAVGSGKTTVLVHKAAYLHVVGGVPLAELAVLTFTTKAADELRARLDELLGRATTPAERWLVGTFHAVALALLDRVLPVAHLGYRAGLAVLDEDAVAELIAELVATHRLRVGQRRTLRARLKAEPRAGDLARLAALLAETKRARNAMDFDDLIDHATALLAAPDVRRPRWVLIDELQDCEPRELELVTLLRGRDAGFFGVGDPRQAIYGWRGGVADGFVRAPAALGCVVHELPVSYRSTRTILDGARAVLGAQPTAGGELHAVRPPGTPIIVRRHHDPVAEATYLAARLTALHAGGVPRADLAVLCRLRAQVDAVAAALAAHGVPCAAERDAAAAVAFDADAVRVLTLHAAKGLEFRHVFIAGANLGIVPLVVRDLVEDEAEERRLLFVGITRARDEVEISYVACPHQFGALGAPSPLLYLLPAPTVAWHDATAPAVAAPAPAVAPADEPAAVAATPSVDEAAPVDPPWRAGQAVRHPRYGAGVVVEVAADTVACEFGKLGARSFPLAMCPLTAVTETAR